MAPPLSDGTNRSTVEAAPTLATSVPDASLPPSKAALLPEFAKLSTSDPSVPITKRIAIVGGGTAGIGQLIALTSLPESVRKGWQIDLFEQREDVGGVWCGCLLSLGVSDPAADRT